jgi:hypothetical protein
MSALVYLAPNTALMKSIFFNYASQQNVFAFIFNPIVISPIARLLAVVRPLAIFRTIISVAIYSVDAFTGWTWPHVVIKIYELVPSATNFYSPTSIVFVCWVFLSITSVMHMSPHAKRFCFGEAMRFLFTSTACGQSKNYGIAINIDNRAAFAAANPVQSRLICVAMGFSFLAYFNKPSVFQTIPSGGYL